MPIARHVTSCLNVDMLYHILCLFAIINSRIDHRCLGRGTKRGNQKVISKSLLKVQAVDNQQSRDQ